MATEDKIRDIIVTSLKYDGSRGRFTDDFPLIDSHVIDSLDMLKLISALEEEFRLEIDDQGLVPTTSGRSTSRSLTSFLALRTGSSSVLLCEAGARNQRS
jgi:acyl carrier protein